MIRKQEIQESCRAPAEVVERTVKGWVDSSWELKQGLEVTEDLPMDAWPLNVAPPPWAAA